MKIQIDIPDELNKSLKIHKDFYNYSNLQETIIAILYNYFIQEKAIMNIYDLKKELERRKK